MNKYLKISIPFIIIVSTILVVYIIFSNPPKAKTKVSKKSTVEVNVQTLKKENFLINLDSFGTAQAKTQTTLSSQVSGKVVYINENFRNGGFFKKNELLIQIEDNDYKADVKIAQAELLLAQQALLEEEAKSKQAKEDWEKFNIKQEPNILVLRLPQLESAKANVIAAQANLQKAKLNLQRTKIKAPFDGRVLEKNISIAQVVSSNSDIGTIVSNEAIEVRLPIKNKELKLIDTNKNHKVTFISETSQKRYEGEIVRSESAIDSNTKQLYLIAQIKKDNENITIGEYLKAKIEAKTLKDVIIIPNDAIYQSSYVYLEKDGVLLRKQIEILWQDDTNSLISNGLQEGDKLVITTLGKVSSGTKVKILNKGSKQ